MAFEKLKESLPKHHLKAILLHVLCCAEHPEGVYVRIGLRGIIVIPQGHYLDGENYIVPDWTMACRN